MRVFRVNMAASPSGASQREAGSDSGSSGSAVHLVTDASSLVDLKAEVFRKKQEAQFNRLHGQSSTASSHFLSTLQGTTSKAKTSSTLKKTPAGLSNRGVAERDQKDRHHPDSPTFSTSHEADTHRARILAAKAQLYEQLQSGSAPPNHEHGDRFLVNFAAQSSNNLHQSDLDEDIDSGLSEDWVEYTDALGRTRRCPKSQLRELQAQDREMGIAHSDESSSATVTSHSQKSSLAFLGAKAPDLLSEDMRRELLRQKWEKEEEENLQKRNVHYQDVLFDEARTHGAAFYRFSRDESERAREKEELEARHHETLVAQDRKHQAKRQRDTLMKDRLKKVRERKRLKMGLPLESEKDRDQCVDERATDLAEPSNQSQEERPEDVEQSIVQGLLALREKAEAERDAKRKAAIREWDLGKEGVPSKPDFVKMKGEKKILDQKEWIQERRSDRSSEFAPPSLYSSNGAARPTRNQNTDERSRTFQAPKAFDRRETRAQKLEDEWLNIPLPGFQNIQSSRTASNGN